MKNNQIKYEACHGPVPAYQFRENISLHNISLEREFTVIDVFGSL